MVDTVKSLLEFSVTPPMDFITTNTASFNMLESVSDIDNKSLVYTPHKVVVVKGDHSGKYLVEYADNLERLMLDQDMGIVEAMQVVADINDIPLDECAVVFDNNCVNRIDIGKVIKADTDFDVLKR